MRFLLFLFLFPFLTQSLDSETNSPTYKFAVLIGEPIALNASENIKVENFDECTKKCGDDANCVMVYQANSSAPCYLFEWNSITQVTKNESGAVGTVGFKVYTEQPSCDLNLPLLLNGKIYPIDPKDTMNNLWKIDTAEDGWVITYIEKRATGGLICGNFTFGRPYVDGCNPECNITMVQVSAKPEEPSSKEQPATSWNECMYWCHSNPDCFVAYFQDGSSTSCKWWAEDEITLLNKTEAADGHHMAVKVPLSDTTCKLGTDQLLNNQSYPEKDPVWKIDKIDDGWEITSVKEDLSLICGNFTNKRPYRDSCDPKCMITMVQVRALPGPIIRHTNSDKMSSWKECLYWCYNNPDCFVAYFQDGVSTHCRWHSIDNIWFLNRTDDPTHHMAIKVPLSSRSCKLKTNELLNDQYYITYQRIRQNYQRSFFRIRTTDKYYKLNTYLDENQIYGPQEMPGCEHSYLSVSFQKKNQLCVKNTEAIGINYIEAKALCKEMDGDLVPLRFIGFAETCKNPATGKSWSSAVVPWSSVDPFFEYGFPDWQKKNIRVWYGLERDPVDQKWKYIRPDWCVTDGSPIPVCHQPTHENPVINYNNVIEIQWKVGRIVPDYVPGYDCAYLNFDYPAYPVVQFVPAPCNFTDVRGFTCATLPQQLRGIPKYQTIADEYGVNEPYTGLLTKWVYG